MICAVLDCACAGEAPIATAEETIATDPATRGSNEENFESQLGIMVFPPVRPNGTR